ncbi:unnamed protein product [Clavelina lepadiformis]|uniref:Uncharacterized protein n=1 Tax=Clavelina lepadiformis TaxID=159417 RepID=A0ABP0FZB7_CLALP
MNLPRFACCRLHDWKWGKFKLNNSRDLKRVYGEVPLSCLCNSVESLSGDFHTAASTMTRAHSVCSECRIRIGTQQTPPCTRYLLPLKAVRCYEDALWRYEKNPSVTTDSGISLNTAVDVVDESDVNSMHPTQQHTLMGLMGLSKAQGSKLRRLPAKTASSFISVGSSTPSSGVCCHVQKSRNLPVLHLQGFGCDPVVDYNLDKNIQPIPLDWWRRHDVAIRSTQFCVDECVRLCVLIAQTKNDAITEHQRTCKVCGSDGSSGLLKILFEDVAGRHGGIVLGPRYSEMLPIVWRPTVREHGLKQEDGKENEEKNRLRFYRQLIEAAVESTRALLLTPDLRPLSSKRNQGNKSLDGDDDGETSYDEAEKTSGHVTRLAHFRGMVKALNELIDEISKLSGAKIINSSDIADAVRLQISDVEIEKLSVIKEEIAPESKVPKVCCRLKGEKSTSSSSPTIKPILTIVESVIQFIKKKMCGAVEDCRNVLHSPWEIPVKEQHVTGKFIAHIMAKLNFKEPSDKEEYSEVMLDDAIEAAIEAFLNDAVFKATTQTCIQRAVKIATDTKQQLAYLDAITRLCAAKIVRYSEVVDAAVKNTRKVVRGCLGAVEEKRRETEFKEDWWKATEKDNENSFAREHISNLIHTGRDDRGSSLDDVLIGFERLRRHIRYDLILANEEVRLIEDMMDEEAMRLYEGTGTKPERHRAASYDAWTESEVALKEKESPDNVTGDRSDAADNDVMKHYLSSRSCSVTDESANVGEDDVSKNQSREGVLGQSSSAQKAGDRSPGHSSELDDMFGGLSQSKKARKKRHFFVKKKDDSNSGSEESLKEELFVDRETWIPVAKVMDRIEKHGIPAGINNVDKDQQIADHTDKLGISNEIQNMSKVLQEPTTDNKKTDKKKQPESFESPISTVHDNTVRSSASVCSATFIGPNPSGGCEEFSYLCDKNSINVNSDSDALSYVTCPSKPGSFSIYEDVLYQESISDQTESTTESEKLLPVIKKDSTSISPSSSNTSFSATSQISSSSCGNVKKSPPPLRLVRFSESMSSCLAIAPSAGTAAKPRNVVTRKRPVGKSRKKRAPRQKFGSVFNKVLDQVTDQEGLTRTALQTFKGKNMLHEIFAKSLTPQQMMDYFHGNIRSLIDMQQTGPTLPHWVSTAAQALLLMMSLGAVTYSCFAAFFYGITDYMLLWAIPIAIFTFGLILEPLKCLGVAWICFLLGWKPVFTNSPLYIKSNPILMKRISSLRPDNTGYINKRPFEFYEHGEPSAPKYEEGLYRRYCANRSRLDCERGQRRKLPSLAESDISLDLDRWQSYGEVDEAEANFISSPLALSEMGDELGSNEAISGFRRGGMDFGVGDASGGFRRGGLDIGGSRKNKEQYPHPMEEPGRTRIVWCRMATSEDGRPPIAIDARRKSINEKSAESL